MNGAQPSIEWENYGTVNDRAICQILHPRRMRDETSMSQKKRSVALFSMCVAVMIMLKIPHNRYTMLIGTLILILVLGILTLVFLLVFRSLKPLPKDASAGLGTQRKRRWWIAFLFCGAVFSGAFEITLDRYSRSLPIFQDAVSSLNVSEVAKNKIGEPIEIGWPVTASLDWSSGSENAELAIPVSGERGKGTLQVVGKKEIGTWRIEGLYLIMRGSTAQENLLASGSNAGTAQ